MLKKLVIITCLMAAASNNAYSVISLNMFKSSASVTKCPNLTPEWWTTKAKSLSSILRQVDVRDTYVPQKKYIIKIDGQKWRLLSVDKTPELHEHSTLDIISHSSTAVNLTRNHDHNNKLQCTINYSNPTMSTGRGSGVTVVIAAP